MRTVGIRELKAHLSRILRDVQAGDDVLVTDRGRVIAELRRPGATSIGGSPAEGALDRLAAQGAVRLRKLASEPYTASPIKSPAGTAAALFADERAER